jgi:hypothetical protein
VGVGTGAVVELDTGRGVADGVAHVRGDDEARGYGEGVAVFVAAIDSGTSAITRAIADKNAKSEITSFFERLAISKS